MDFSKYRDDPERLTGFLLALPLREGKSVNDLKRDLAKKAETKALDRADFKEAEEALSQYVSLEAPEFQVLGAFEILLDVVSRTLESGMSGARIFKTRSLTLSFTPDDQVFLEAFQQFLEGKSDQVLDDILVRTLPEKFKFSSYSALLKSPETLSTLRAQALAFEHPEASQSAVEIAGASLADLKRKADEIKSAGKRPVYQYTLGRSEQRSGERSSAREETSLASKIEVARSVSEGILDPKIRSEIRQEIYQTLWPESRSNISSLLIQTMASSQRPVTAVSYISEMPDPGEMEDFLKASLAVLGVQVQKTYEMMVVVPDGMRKDFEVFMQRGLDKILAENELARDRSLRSRLRVLSLTDFERLGESLLSHREVLRIGPSSLSPQGRGEGVEFHFLTDRLLDGTKLLAGDQRKNLGSFVFGAFEAILIPPQDQQSAARGPEGAWLFRNSAVLQTMTQSLDELLEASLAVRQAA